MSDPKLKEAMAEIMGVLKKHDIAGSVVLCSKSHTEFRFNIEPSWSCARMVEDNGRLTGVNFKVTKAEIPDKEERKVIAEKTAHIIYSLRDCHAIWFAAFDNLAKQLEKHMTIEHIPFSGFEPHRDN